MMQHRRPTTYTLLAAVLLNAATLGCAALAPSGGQRVVTGTVTHSERIALPADAEIEVSLIDATLADAPSRTLDVQRFKAGGRQVPFPFRLSYDADEIDPRFRYQVRATITIGGQLAYTSDTAIPVITDGAPTSDVQILVRPTSR